MRTTNRLLTLLVSVALILLGLLLAVEVALAVFGAHPALLDWRPAYRAGESDSWDSTAVRVLAGSVAVVGLLLLMAELKPRRVRRLPISSQDPHTDPALTKAGLRSALRRAAEDVDGIAKATVKIRRRTAKVTATSRAGQGELAQALDTEVKAAVSDRLTAMQLRRPPRPRTRVQTRKASS